MNTIHTTWRHSIAILSLVLLTTVIYGCAVAPTQDRQKQQTRAVEAPNAERAAQHADSVQGDGPAAMSAEEAFNKGVEAVRGHVDRLDSKWQVSFRRAESNKWFMTISRFPKPGMAEIKILIGDDGNVSVLPGL